MTKQREKRVTVDHTVITRVPNKVPTGIAGFDEITSGGLPRSASYSTSSRAAAEATSL